MPNMVNYMVNYMQNADGVRDIIESRKEQGYNHFTVETMYDDSKPFPKEKGFKITSYVSSLPSDTQEVENLQKQVKGLQENIQLYKKLLKDLL